MPRGEIKKDDIDPEIFMYVIHQQCHSSIKKLGECKEVECTERTLRRAKEKKKINPQYLKQIAKYLNVDSRLLSGELHKQAETYTNDFLKELYLAQLTKENYPYYKERKTELSKQPMDTLLEHILSLFEISLDQFKELEFEPQYAFQHDLLEAIVPVIRKHFKVDAYGRKEMPDLERIIYELENYKDDYYLHIYAEEILRPKMLKHPPKGMSKHTIKSMNADDLLAFNALKD